MKLDLLEADDIVISGIGCYLSETNDLSQLAGKLFGENVSMSESSKNHSGIQTGGKINFDYTFFGMSHMSSMHANHVTLMILEKTFEAVIDAGINPSDIKGMNAPVLSSVALSDSDVHRKLDPKAGYGIVAKFRAFEANRVSYWLDLKGTSVCYYDRGMQNIFNGYESIRTGLYDTAIVATANFKPLSETMKLIDDCIKVSPDGKCKSYDDSADGWSPSDGVVVFVLQRAKIAKRCYAVIEHAMFQVYTEMRTVFNKPCQQYWETMLKEFYAQSKINPNDIFYVEGHGAGIKEDDTEELNALTAVFCKNRPTPLLLGSIKSNIGYTDSASASCGILKAIISFERGTIPKNLNYNSPNSSSPGLMSGRIQVVNNHTQIPLSGLIAVNSYCFGGMYGHLVLRGNSKTRKTKYDEIPRLVPLSVRQDEDFEDVVSRLEAETFDVELIYMLHDIFSKKMEKYLSRGYTILPKLNDISIREHQVYDDVKRPVCFIFSGMGSQWPEMGKRLMDLPMFRSSIEKSHAILKKKGLNLIDIITTDDSKVFDNILHSFVGIAAIQIALVDILNALDIVPDNIIGHSVGELGCAYADGCLTAEQTILCAYSRGKACIETSLIKGLMAAIGKGFNKIKDELPAGIEVACHNGPDSCTISGPAELVQNYVKELEDRKVFAKLVNVSNIAYHSQYIKPAAPKFLEYLRDIIPEPKLISEKWISTSISQENVDNDLAKYCSAEYHTNNLLSSVYFEEGIKKIPEKAICIEIAPHGLMQAIIKRSLQKKCINIPLTNRSAKDALQFLLQALGKMYIAGLYPKIQKLYPSIEYPVSRGTGSLAPFVRWDHSSEFTSVRLRIQKEVMYSLKDKLKETSKDEIGYLIDGTNYYPFSVFIVLIWKTLASLLKKELEDCPVLIKNVRAEKLVPVDITEADKVSVSIGIGTGQFEIFMNRIIATGTIILDDNLKRTNPKENIKNQTDLKSVIFENFDRKDYVIGKYFKNLTSVENVEEVRKGKIEISSDWLQTLESMIQLKLLDQSRRSEALLFPLSIEKLIISPDTHQIYKDLVKDEFNGMVAELHKLHNVIKCGGIEMKGLQMQILPRISSKLKFQSTRFVPFMNPPLKDSWRFVDYCFRILKNNCQESEISILEITNGIKVPFFASYLKNRFPDTKINTERTECKETKNVLRKYDLVISNMLEEATSLINKGGFILALCPKTRAETIPSGLVEVTKYSFHQDDYILLKKREILTNVDYIVIPDNESALCNVIKEIEHKANKVVYLVGYSEVNEKTKKRLQKGTSTQLRWIFILDKQIPAFDAGNPFFIDQLLKGLRTNIYLDGSWGLFYRRNFTKEKFHLDSVFTSVNDELTTAYFGTDIDENLLNSDKFKVEYSGVLKDKTQVMGIATIANKEFLVDNILQWRIPSHWSQEEGATVPLSHSLAYYYLKIVSNLEPGASVLITDGLSVNGRAAISVALALGLKVHVTVNEEKEILQITKLFPYVDKEDVVIHKGDFDLRAPCSAKYSELATLVIMNNLEEEKLESAVNNVPENGIIFHFGKKDLQKNTELGMYCFLNSISLYGTSSTIFDRLSIHEKTKIQDFVKTGIKNGFIKPLPRTVRNAKEIEDKNITDIRRKVLFESNEERELNRCWTHPQKSYLIIDDESNFGLKVSEWLSQQNVHNIIISPRNPPFTTRSLYIKQEQLQRQANVILENDSSGTSLLTKAKTLAPIAAVFFIKMDEIPETSIEMDKLYTEFKSRLIFVTNDDSLSEFCTARTNKGYITTNFIWKAKKEPSYRDLSLMMDLCGQDSVITVSDDYLDQVQRTKQIFFDTLPNSIQKYCDIGSSLCEDVTITELPNLGLKHSEVKEVSPIFILPGLQDDPMNTVLSLSKRLMYPVFLVKVPKKSYELSIEKLGSLISSKIQLENQFEKHYNILGVSWGSYLSVEVAKRLENSGKIVSLILIEVPQISENMKFFWGKNLADVICRTSGQNTNDISHQGLLSLDMDNITKNLNLTEEAKFFFKNAVNYIYNCIEAIINYNYSDIKLKGILTIIEKDVMDVNGSLKKLCDNVSFQIIPAEQVNDLNFLTSKTVIDTINGSAIAASMSDHTVQYSTYKEFEEFLADEKLVAIRNDIIMQQSPEWGFSLMRSATETLDFSNI